VHLASQFPRIRVKTVTGDRPEASHRGGGTHARTRSTFHRPGPDGPHCPGRGRRRRRGRHRGAHQLDGFLARIDVHDPVHDVLRLHAISTDREYREKDKYVALPTDGDHIGASVWREQKPLVLSPLENETRWSGVVQEMLDEGIHALTLVPLSNGNRRLGILAFGFTEPFQPDEEALRFLSRVASEFAVAHVQVERVAQ